MVDDQSYETSVETAKREAEEQIKQIETLYLQKVEDLRGRLNAQMERLAGRMREYFQDMRARMNQQVAVYKAEV